MDRARCSWVLFLLMSLACGRTALDAGRRHDGGGMVESGGAFSTGGAGGTGGIGSEASGGTSSTGDTGRWGSPCSDDRDCREGGICCDGLTQSCDITRLPKGDANNPSELSYVGDDVIVTDTITGLVWQRDVMGMRSTCGFEKGVCSWSDAMGFCSSRKFAGLSGWRLPGRMELLTIADFTRMPALDSRAFPITPDGADFWTSSPDANAAGRAWQVSCGPGSSSMTDGADLVKARCVRGARCVPKVRFAVLEGRIVRDKVTGLLWQQVASPTAMTWADAQSHCPTLGTGFRLPTVKELASIVDLTVTSPRPTMDTSAFPNVPASSGAYWTSTPYGTSPGTAYQIHFGSGIISTENTGNRFWVRCVSSESP